MLIRDFKRDVSGNLASATGDDPLVINRYSAGYRAIVPLDWYERASQALREKEAATDVAVTVDMS